jgi:GST-like protein
MGVDRRKQKSYSLVTLHPAVHIIAKTAPNMVQEIAVMDLHFWPTPNGWKVTIMLEECGLPYRVVPIDITAGEQLSLEFQALNPNGRMPVLVDGQPNEGGPPLTVFESGAILLYLAEKANEFMPANRHERFAVMQWLMWQMSGLGPMAGQNGHFLLYASEKVPYAIERYGRETRRLYSVLDEQLSRTGRCVAGEYSIADIAIFPWIMTHKAQGMNMADYPNVRRWFSELRARPALQRGIAVNREMRLNKLDDKAKRILFNRPPET